MLTASGGLHIPQCTELDSEQCKPNAESKDVNAISQALLRPGSLEPCEWNYVSTVSQSF